MFTLLFPVKEMKSEASPDRRAPGRAEHHGGVPLDRLPQSAKGAVTSIGGASTPLRQRLMELGITIGSEIEVIRKAPFGGPIEISVRGYRLSLRRTEAHIVMIDRLG
jgi:Fe2+ transport system protein FeoA